EALNGKMKQLKKKGIVSQHHDYLTDNELKKIFQHEKVLIDTPQRLIYRIFMWSCFLFQPCGGEHYKISIKQFNFTPNGESYQGPVHDFKFYFSKKPLNSSYDSLYLRINKEAK
ncbi:2948_t:CDS:2, partial [Racocetra persica]